MRALTALAFSLVACGPSLDPVEAGSLGACRELRVGAIPDATSLVLVVNDAMRRDRAAVYGGSARTPRFDAFARAHLLFESAVAPAPWTKPSIATLFTSLHPSQHGVTDATRGDGGSAGLLDRDPRALGETEMLGAGFQTLAESLRDAGLRTAAFVGNPWLVHQLGFDQGFETYHDSLARWAASGEEVAGAALQWLQGVEPAERFFLYLHFMDSHLPYGPLTERDVEEVGGLDDPRRLSTEGRRLLQQLWSESGNSRLLAADELSVPLLERAYDRGVERFDHGLGLLLDGLASRPDWPRTALVVTSDHGEALYERGWGNHGRSLFDPELLVPLAVRLPGVGARDGRVSCPVGLIDLAPTFCDYLEVRCPDSFAGTSLLADAPAGRYLVSELFPSGQLRRAIRNQRFKLIYRPATNEHALYDLGRDPDELQNLLDPDAGVRGAAAVATVMRQALPGSVPPFEPPPAPRVPLDPELQRRLEDLGYLDTMR